MLSKLRVQHYKSLFDTEVSLEPLTVFIGPNGSGKSNICEAIAVLSDFLQKIITTKNYEVISRFSECLNTTSKNLREIESKFWHGKLDHILFEVSAFSTTKEGTSYDKNETVLDLSIYLNYPQRIVYIRNIEKTRSVENTYTNALKQFLISNKYLDSPLANALKKVSIYDFAPVDISSNATSTDSMGRTGQGIAYSLVDILHTNRKSFDELEERLTRLVPNIERISLPRGENRTFLLELIDKYSEHHIPASDISDGTLRILAFLTALYQENTPSIICFEEIENGVHPWLLHKMIELLKIVSTEGIAGKPVQVLITTHSPVLLNYVEPHQVRAVELDNEGKTQVHTLPTDSARFQKALEAYDGALGELWFTNVFGGNPV